MSNTLRERLDEVYCLVRWISRELNGSGAPDIGGLRSDSYEAVKLLEAVIADIAELEEAG